MDEEQMWKGFFFKLQELKMNPPTEHETQLQDVDDGFFEKFGALLRQKSQIDEGVLKSSLAPFGENGNAEDSDESPDGTLKLDQDPECTSIDTFTTESEAASVSDKDISATVLDAAPVMNGIIILLRSLQRSKGNIFDAIKYIFFDQNHRTSRSSLVRCVSFYAN